MIAAAGVLAALAGVVLVWSSIVGISAAEIVTARLTAQNSQAQDTPAAAPDTRFRTQ